MEIQFDKELCKTCKASSVEKLICGRWNCNGMNKSQNNTIRSVNICGVPHKIEECKDSFDIDLHMGQIDYKNCTIKINADMTEDMKKEAICHEMVHGIFLHLGYNDYTNDEQLVQALANAISQGFSIKYIEGVKKDE